MLEEFYCWDCSQLNSSIRCSERLWLRACIRGNSLAPPLVGFWWPGAGQSELSSINPTFGLNSAPFLAGLGQTCDQAAGERLNYLLSWPYIAGKIRYHYTVKICFLYWVYSVQCALYSVTVYSVQCTLYSVQCNSVTVYSVTAYSVHCTV